MQNLQDITNVESLGWQFANNGVGEGLTGKTTCNVYTGEFFGLIYCLTVHSDNTIKLQTVFELLDKTDSENIISLGYEFKQVYYGSCQDIDSLQHIFNEVANPKKQEKSTKQQGKRKQDKELKPKEAK